MEQIKIDNLRFSDLLSKFTGISKAKIDSYIKTNSIDNIFSHPTSISSNPTQVKKIEELRELRNLYNRIKLQEENKYYALNSSVKAGEYFKTYFADIKDKEHFLCSFLDSQSRIIATKVISSGTVNESGVYVREVVKEALMYDANAVILSHNHPGGTLNPSKADINMTGLVNQAFASVGIKVNDHIIVADDKYYSFAESGKLEASIQNIRSVMETSVKETSVKERMSAAKEQANGQRSNTAVISPKKAVQYDI